jgi:predicted TIM-barrel fold metal-dependent hydrolase
MTPLLDTHQHLLYPDRFTYPWTEGAPQLEGRAFPYEDYVDAAAGCDIHHTLFMEAAASDPVGEVAFVASLADDPRVTIAGLIAAVAPERDDFEIQLDLLAGARVVGVRRMLHTDADDLSRRPGFRANLRRLADHALPFELCALARQLGVATELVEACPDVEFVLDHCGVPDIAGAGLEPWREDISRLAEHRNVHCKISGVLAYCPPGQASADAVRPYVEHCISAFGWDRVVWGSDWPVLLKAATLREWVAVTRRIVDGEPEENRRRLFHENASRLYRLAGVEPRKH